MFFLLKRSLQEQGFSIVDIYPAIVGKFLGTVFGRAIGHVLQWFLIVARRLFPLVVSRYIVESYLVVAQKRT